MVSSTVITFTRMFTSVKNYENLKYLPFLKQTGDNERDAQN